MNEEMLRVTVSEGARLFGLEQRTIRRAIKNGEIAYVIVRGRYRINFKSLLHWSQGKPTVRKKLEIKGIGQFVERWKITNTRFSPNPALLKRPNDEKPTDSKPSPWPDAR